jgi:hypothetical protein
VGTALGVAGFAATSTTAILGELPTQTARSIGSMEARGKIVSAEIERQLLKDAGLVGAGTTLAAGIPAEMIPHVFAQSNESPPTPSVFRPPAPPKFQR